MSAETYNEKQLADGHLSWEMISELGKFWQRGHGLEADGYIGPNTQASLTHATADPHEPGTVWTPWDGPLTAQPRTRREVYDFFGNPGTAQVDQDWEHKNIVELHGDNRLPGVPERWYVKVHKLVEPYVREGLRRAQISSPYRIDRFAGFVFRHQRYDNSRPLSYHSWGIAVDVDGGDRNTARTFKGNYPKPWSSEWMTIWPHGVDQPFVEAMESCGFHWGGRWTNFCESHAFRVGRRCRGMSAATVNISLDELDALRAQLRRAHEEKGKLADKIKELEVVGIGDGAGLLVTIHHTLDIVRFAVANLDPRTVKGWPWAAVAAFADDLEELPGADENTHDLAIELRAFAHECELLESTRRNRPADKPAPPAPDMVVSPDPDGETTGTPPSA